MSKEMYETETTLQRIVVLDNPFSKNGHRGRRQVEELVEYSELPKEAVTTTADPEETADKLKLEANDLLIVIGGDGTVNSTLDPLMQSGAVLLPSRSGNANDLAMSVNGKRSLVEVFDSFLRGDAAIVESNPLSIAINDSQPRTAINYASFGYAALASNYVNLPWPSPAIKPFYDRLPRMARNVIRFPHDGHMLLKAAADMALFSYQEEDGLERQVADITMAHSKRMAKLGRFHIRHTDSEFFYSILDQTGARAMAEQYIKMTQARLVGQRVTEAAFSIKQLTDQQLFYQLDGEDHLLPEKARVAARLSESGVRILSSELKPAS